MARVDVVFSLTDRVSRRMEAIQRRAEKLELILKRLDQQFDRINRKAARVERRLRAFDQVRATATIDANIRPLLRKVAEAHAALGTVGNRGVAGSIRGSGGGGSGGGVSSGGGGGGVVSSFVGQLRRDEQEMAYRRRVMANRSSSGAWTRDLFTTGSMDNYRRRVGPGGSYERNRYMYGERLPEMNPANWGGRGGAAEYLRRTESERNRGMRGGWKGRGASGFGSVYNLMTNDEGPIENFFTKRILRGGRGGWFRGGSLLGLLAGSGLMAAGVGGASALGAGAMSLLPMLAAGGGLLGTIGAVGMPLAQGAIKGQKRITSAQEALAAAKTPEEVAEALKELREAEKALTPVQKSVIKDFGRMKVAFQALVGPLQPLLARTFGTVTNTFERMAPQLAPHMRGFMNVGQRLADRTDQFFSNPRELALFNRFMQPLPALSEQLGVAIGRLAVTFMRLSTAVTPLAIFILKELNQWLGALNDKLARPGAIDKTGDKFMMWAPVLKNIAGLVKDVVNSFIRLGPDVLPITQQFINLLRGPFIMAFESIIRASAGISGPAVLGALEQILLLIDELAPEIATIIKFVAKAIEWLVRAIRELNNMTGGSVEWFLGGAVAIGIIFKFVKLLDKATGGFILFKAAAKGIRWIMRGMFPLAALKTFTGRLPKLIALLWNAAAASNAIGAGGIGGVGGRASKAGKLIGVAAKVGGAALGITAGYEFAQASSGQPGLSRPVEDYWGNFTNWLGGGTGGRAPQAQWFGRQRPGQPNPFLGRAMGGMARGPVIAGERGDEAVISFSPQHRGRNVALARAAMRRLGGTGGGGSVVNINGPININHERDEKAFFTRLQRAVEQAGTNMPHTQYNPRGTR